MNRLIILLSLLLVTAAARAEYDFPNYFTMGENDTLRVAAGSDTVTVPVRAHFEGLVSRWTLTLTYPEGLTPLWVINGPDMAVPYLNSQGEECIYNGVVTASLDMTTISSVITVAGYWPYGGGYFSFGSAMWDAGDYDEMFYLTLVVSQGFTGGQLTIDGTLVGNAGPIGGVGHVVFYKVITVTVTHPDGDVNYDGAVNIADVTALISQVLSGTTTEAGDLNGDGTVNIADVTALISFVLANGGTLDFDPTIDI